MSAITIEALSNLIHDYISAQAKRDAERDAQIALQKAELDAQIAKLNAERAKAETERDAQIAMQKAERAKKDEKYEKQWERLQQDLVRLGNSYGDQVEAMFVNLGSKFNSLGHSFPREAKVTTFRDKNGRVIAEVDRFLENGDVVIAVEVKAKLKQDHVDDHIERLGIISNHFTERVDNRKVLGAVAGGNVPENVLKYAQRKGLYVLVQNGESIELATMPTNFIPQEW